MPQLPSGRHVGLRPDGLIELVEAAAKGFRVHELMEIENLGQLPPFVSILFFRAREHRAPESIDLAKFSAVPPGDLEPYPSGFTLETIRAESASWSQEDRHALDAFVSSARVQNHLAELLGKLKVIKAKIASEGPLAARVQALWWQEGVHPLQPGGDA